MFFPSDAVLRQMGTKLFLLTDRNSTGKISRRTVRIHFFRMRQESGFSHKIYEEMKIWASILEQMVFAEKLM